MDDKLKCITAEFHFEDEKVSVEMKKAEDDFNVSAHLVVTNCHSMPSNLLDEIFRKVDKFITPHAYYFSFTKLSLVVH